MNLRLSKKIEAYAMPRYWRRSVTLRPKSKWNSTSDLEEIQVCSHASRLLSASSSIVTKWQKKREEKCSKADKTDQRDSKAQAIWQNQSLFNIGPCEGAVRPHSQNYQWFQYRFRPKIPSSKIRKIGEIGLAISQNLVQTSEIFSGLFFVDWGRWGNELKGD